MFATSPNGDVLSIKGPDYPILFFPSPDDHLWEDVLDVIRGIPITNVGAVAVHLLLAANAQFRVCNLNQDSVGPAVPAILFSTPNGLSVGYAPRKQISVQSDHLEALGIHIIVGNDGVIWRSSSEIPDAPDPMPKEEHSHRDTDPAETTVPTTPTKHLSIMNYSPTKTPPTIDADEFWQLQEPSRFPTTKGACQKQTHIPTQEAPPWGPKLPVLITRRQTAVLVSWALSKVTTTHKKIASSTLNPEQWRQLYYVDQYPLSVLCRSTPDVLEVFRAIWSQDQWFLDVPPEWLGSKNSADIMEDIREIIETADASVLLAIYSILSLARSAGFEKNEILQVPFWELRWIEGYLSASGVS